MAEQIPMSCVRLALVLCGALASAGGCARTPRSLLGAREQAASGEARVRVLSLNAWLLPGFSALYKERLERLPAALAEVAPDVICLQEVWLPAARDSIAERLAPGYVATTGRAGGLVTFARRPILSQDFVPFPREAGMPAEERLAGKGLLVTVVEGPRGRLRVVNTHLAQRWNAEGVNERQLAFLREQIGALTDLPMVLAGDLNHALCGDPWGLAVEERALWRQLGFTHADPLAEDCVGDLPAGSARPRIRCTRVGWPAPEGEDEEGWTPDHILHRGTLWQTTLSRGYRVLFTTPADALSDHRGLLVDLALAP